MKIHVLSDLHIEFADLPIPRTDADVVVLAGDVGVKMAGLKYVLSQWDTPVVYVAGNHEYYGAAIPHLTDQLRAAAAGANVNFLEKAELIVDDVRFLGCTLWTDFLILGEDRHELAMWEAEENMTDYHRIRCSPKFSRLHPRETLSMHLVSVRWLERSLATPFDGRTVVVTHHAPSAKSLDGEYASDYLTAAYASDLDDLITRSDIDVWIHGHTHRCVDLMHGTTRIVSNQRGYPDEPVAGFDGALVINV